MWGAPSRLISQLYQYNDIPPSLSIIADMRCHLPPPGWHGLLVFSAEIEEVLLNQECLPGKIFMNLLFIVVYCLLLCDIKGLLTLLVVEKINILKIIKIQIQNSYFQWEAVSLRPGSWPTNILKSINKTLEFRILFCL